MNNYIIIIIISLLEMLYQYLIQQSALDKKYNFIFFLAFIILISYNILYYLILKNGLKLGIAHSLQHSCGIIFVFLLGYFVFNQKINIKQIVGVLFLLTGMIMISYFDKS
tara:strand:+ start:366 stop:695 length:330 start_codon:yes stop_codon:yes gene_type:complete